MLWKVSVRHQQLLHAVASLCWLLLSVGGGSEVGSHCHSWARCVLTSMMQGASFSCRPSTCWTWRWETGAGFRLSLQVSACPCSSFSISRASFLLICLSCPFQVSAPEAKTTAWPKLLNQHPQLCQSNPYNKSLSWRPCIFNWTLSDRVYVLNRELSFACLRTSHWALIVSSAVLPASLE